MFKTLRVQVADIVSTVTLGPYRTEFPFGVRRVFTKKKVPYVSTPTQNCGHVHYFEDSLDRNSSYDSLKSLAI